MLKRLISLLQPPKTDHSAVLSKVQIIQNLKNDLQDQVESNAGLYEQSRRDLAEGVALITNPVNAAYAEQSVFSVTEFV